MWRAEWKSVGKAGFQVHLPACGTREVVAEEEVYVISLVGGLRDAFPIESHLCFHQSETDPGIRTGNKLTIQFEVGSYHISRGAVVSIIDYFHIVHIVRIQSALSLVIQFCGELEGSVGQFEFVFHGRQYLE